MNAWRHTACYSCWKLAHPDDEPIRLKGELEVPCCFCDGPTSDGIYVRADPATMHCGGRGGEHEPGSHPDRPAGAALWPEGRGRWRPGR